MRRVTTSASSLAANLGESMELVVRICMDPNMFLTGYVDQTGPEPQLDEDAIEEVKEKIAELRETPNSIDEFMALNPSSIQERDVG